MGGQVEELLNLITGILIEKSVCPDPLFFMLKDKKAWRNISRREQKEFDLVQRMVRKKDEPKLGKWLEKFSIEGDFWSKRRSKKDDYL